MATPTSTRPHSATSSRCFWSATRQPETGSPPSTQETIESVARNITERVEQLGGTFVVPAMTLARMVVATTDGVVLGTYLDGVDLYGPFLEMFVAGISGAGDLVTRRHCPPE